MLNWLWRLLKPVLDRPNWEQRVDFWPKEYPHRIVTWANVAMLKSIMATSGSLNYPAIEVLVRREDFWHDLAGFFNDQVRAVQDEEGVTLEKRHAVAFFRSCKLANVPTLLWEVEADKVPRRM